MSNVDISYLSLAHGLLTEYLYFSIPFTNGDFASCTLGTLQGSYNISLSDDGIPQNSHSRKIGTLNDTAECVRETTYFLSNARTSRQRSRMLAEMP